VKNHLIKFGINKTTDAELQPNSDKEVIVLPVFEVKDQGKGFEKMESIKPSASDIPETLEPI
jgi:hypothetical protein